MRDTMGLILLDQGADPADFTDDEWDSALAALQEASRLRPDPAVHRQRLRRSCCARATSPPASRGPATSSSCSSTTPNIKFVLPEAGAMLWSDNMLIPINAQHKENAEQWMNYYYDPEVAAELAAWVNYICPVEGAQEEMAKIDPKLADEPADLPDRRRPRQLSIFGPHRRGRDPVRPGVPGHRGLISGLSFRVRPCHTEPLRQWRGAPRVRPRRTCPPTDQPTNQDR